MKRIVRTKEDCLNISKKYTHRNEFKHANNAVYYYARKYGWLDDICEHMIPIKEKKTKEQCHAVALKYNRRIDFADGDNKTYYYARYYGWLDDICEHMTPCFVFRTKEECLDIAKKYTRRVDLLREHGGVYKKITLNGWQDELFSHMKYQNQIIDVVYMWKVKEIDDLWKIGISNVSCLKKRIWEVSIEQNLSVDVVHMKVSPIARKLEKILLRLGSPSDIRCGSGRTEFRFMDESDFKKAMDIFKE